MYSKIKLLLSLVLLLTLPINPQQNEIIFSNLTTEDGISLNAVTSILQDSKGFLWFGTYNGLNRYDGYNFKVFLPDRSNPSSISNHSIGPLFEDREGYLWIATKDGLNRYDRKTEKFKVYKNNPDDSLSLCNNYVYTITEDKEGTIWVGTMNGLSKYNRKKDNFTSIKKVCADFNQNGFNSVVHAMEDSDGLLWLATWNGVTCMDKNGKMLKSYFTQSIGSKNFNYRSVNTLFEDNQKNIWIGTDKKGVINLNRYSGRYEIYQSDKRDVNSISNNNITTIFQDKKGNIWLGSRDGFNKFNTSKKNFTRYLHDHLKPSTIINDNIYCITQDNNGIIWIGTEGGVSRFSLPHNNFHYYSKETGLSSNRVTAVHLDSKGNTWIGTFDGLDQIDSQGKLIHHKHIPGKNSISHNFILSIKEDHLGYIWIGTQNDGLNRYDPETGEFKLYVHSPADTQSISNVGITSIYEDRNGTMWFGTWWGLNKFDRKTEKFYRYIANPDNKNALIQDLIWNIFEDSEGMIWVGTDGGGVSRLDPKTNRFTNFTRNSPIPYRISENRVFCSFESRDKIMWIATSDGLTSYDRKTGKISIYSTKDGLAGNMICSVAEDNNGNLWFGTDRGLSMLDKSRKHFTNYGKRNGIKELEFTLNVVDKAKDGTIYFGTKYGLFSFNPKTIKSEELNASVVFTDLKLYNKSVTIEDGSVLKKSIVESGSISIPSDKEVITIDFALLDYFDSKRNQFKYKLKGFDKDWNEVGTRNNVTYTNLPPGEYTLYVRATTNNGPNTEKQASLHISIIPAYYQTLWFRISAALFVGIFIIVFSHLRTGAVKKQNKILEAKVAERTKDLDKTINELSLEISSKNKFFSVIAHDLRSPFTALLGLTTHLYDEINNLTKEDLQLIADNLLKSAKVTFNLLENLLQWARIKTGKMTFNPKEIDLSKLSEGVIDLYRSNAYSKSISIIPEIKGSITISADQNMIETILRNLISNAIKFTPVGGYIYIKIKDDPGCIEISVVDTGIGMSIEKLNRLFLFEQNVSSMGTQNEKGSGLGLILCKEFIEIHKGKMFIESKPGEGSTFSFTLPKNADQI